MEFTLKTEGLPENPLGKIMPDEPIIIIYPTPLW